ncbi:hypothetical protein [Nonomuraea sp. B19D2]|uniref:hypothetical protein n=1 Tax=Nonomuraea sp. B19D2 TaxID=3159561 RepID=UPI0032DB23A5
MVLVVVVAAGQQQQVGTEPVHPLLQQVHQLAQADGVQPLGELPIPVGDLVAEPPQLAHLLDLGRALPVRRRLGEAVVAHAIDGEVEHVNLAAVVRQPGEEPSAAEHLVIGVRRDQQNTVKAAHSAP